VLNSITPVLYVSLSYEVVEHNSRYKEALAISGSKTDSEKNLEKYCISMDTMQSLENIVHFDGYARYKPLHTGRMFLYVSRH